jgi:hypothetical protein
MRGGVGVGESLIVPTSYFAAFHHQAGTYRYFARRAGIARLAEGAAHELGVEIGRRKCRHFFGGIIVRVLVVSCIGNGLGTTGGGFGVGFGCRRTWRSFGGGALGAAGAGGGSNLATSTVSGTGNSKEPAPTSTANKMTMYPQVLGTRTPYEKTGIRVGTPGSIRKPDRPTKYRVRQWQSSAISMRPWL